MSGERGVSWHSLESRSPVTGSWSSRTIRAGPCWDYLGTFNCETPWENMYMPKCPQTLCAHLQCHNFSAVSDLVLIQGCAHGESFHKTEQTHMSKCWKQFLKTQETVILTWTGRTFGFFLHWMLLWHHNIQNLQLSFLVYEYRWLSELHSSRSPPTPVVDFILHGLTHTKFHGITFSGMFCSLLRKLHVYSVLFMA